MKHASIIALLLSISFMPVQCMGEKTALLSPSSQHGASPSASHYPAPPPYTVNDGDVEMRQLPVNISQSQSDSLVGAPSNVQQRAGVNNLKKCKQCCISYCCHPVCLCVCSMACLVGVVCLLGVNPDPNGDVAGFIGGSHRD